MNSEQKKLIDKTLSVFGYLSFIGAGGLVLYAVVWELGYNGHLGQFISKLLDIHDAGMVFYPLVGAGVLLLWIRAFLRAGNSQTNPTSAKDGNLNVNN